MIVSALLRYALSGARGCSEIPLKFTLCDGSVIETHPGTTPGATVRFLNWRGEWRTILFSGPGFVEGYIHGDIEIEGDFLNFLTLPYTIEKNKKHSFDLLNTIRNYWHELRFGGFTIQRRKRNARAHYNRGTEMFRKYLDPSMTYTCAYWNENARTLADAQAEKNRHVLKKLVLEPGMTLVDVGGGWCPLLMMAAEEHGVIGTNVSPTPDQNEATRREIERRGLTGKVFVHEADFAETPGTYDRYVSLGVYEHAGKSQLEEWIKSMAACTKEGGIGMLHFIGTVRGGLNQTGIFIRKHIFPGGYLPGLAETLEIMAKYDLEVLDIENLRRHYFHTLKAWAENFDANWEAIHALDPEKYDERFRRTWRVYLYGCAVVFKQTISPSEVGLFQVLWSKGRTNTYPMTRKFLYTNDEFVLPLIRETKQYADRA